MSFSNVVALVFALYFVLVAAQTVRLEYAWESVSGASGYNLYYTDQQPANLYSKSSYGGMQLSGWRSSPYYAGSTTVGVYVDNVPSCYRMWFALAPFYGSTEGALQQLQTLSVAVPPNSHGHANLPNYGGVQVLWSVPSPGELSAIEVSYSIGQSHAADRDYDTRREFSTDFNPDSGVLGVCSNTGEKLYYALRGKCFFALEFSNYTAERSVNLPECALSTATTGASFTTEAPTTTSSTTTIATTTRQPTEQPTQNPTGQPTTVPPTPPPGAPTLAPTVSTSAAPTSMIVHTNSMTHEEITQAGTTPQVPRPTTRAPTMAPSTPITTGGTVGSGADDELLVPIIVGVVALLVVCCLCAILLVLLRARGVGGRRIQASIGAPSAAWGGGGVDDVALSGSGTSFARRRTRTRSSARRYTQTSGSGLVWSPVSERDSASNQPVYGKLPGGQAAIQYTGLSASDVARASEYGTVSADVLRASKSRYARVSGGGRSRGNSQLRRSSSGGLRRSNSGGIVRASARPIIEYGALP